MSEFFNGVRNGRGFYQYSNGDTYMGGWKDGKKSGVAQVYYASSRITFEGNFFEGLKHGKGTMKYDDGRSVEQDWNAGALLEEIEI